MSNRRWNELFYGKLQKNSYNNKYPRKGGIVDQSKKRLGENECFETNLWREALFRAAKDKDKDFLSSPVVISLCDVLGIDYPTFLSQVVHIWSLESNNNE